MQGKAVWELHHHLGPAEDSFYILLMTNPRWHSKLLQTSYKNIIQTLHQCSTCKLKLLAPREKKITIKKLTCILLSSFLWNKIIKRLVNTLLKIFSFKSHWCILKLNDDLQLKFILTWPDQLYPCWCKFVLTELSWKRTTKHIVQTFEAVHIWYVTHFKVILSLNDSTG